MKKVCRNLIQNAGVPTFGICEPAENVGKTWLYSPHDRTRLQPVLVGKSQVFSLAGIKVRLDSHNLANKPRHQNEMLLTGGQKMYRRSQMAIGRHEADRLSAGTLRIERHRADRLAPSLNLRKSNS